MFKLFLSQDANARPISIEIKSNSGSEEEFRKLSEGMQEYLTKKLLPITNYSKSKLKETSVVKFLVQPKRPGAKPIEIKFSSDYMPQEDLLKFANHTMGYCREQGMEVKQEFPKLTRVENVQPIPYPELLSPSALIDKSHTSQSRG